jgi:hypothetical protein
MLSVSMTGSYQNLWYGGRVMFSYVICYLEEPVLEQYCELTM